MLFGPTGDPRELWHGEATGGTLSADGATAYLSGGPDGRQLLHADLADFARTEVRTVAQLPSSVGPLALSPGGRHLATATTSNAWSSPDPPPPPEAVLVDLAASPPVVTEVQLSQGSGAPYSTVWASADRVVFVPAWNGEPVRVFDTTRTEVGSWSGWSASTSTVVGDRLVGLSGGMVVTAPLLTGPVSQWADLESGLPGTVVAFPGGAAVGSAAQSPSTTTTVPPSPNSESTGEHAVAALPAEGDPGTGGRPLLVGGAGAALLAATAAAFVRRRRLPKLPELPG